MRKKVLIFDDDQDLLDICSLILRQKNFDISTRENCADILRHVAAFEPGVIIMDCRIPDIGGIKAVQLLKQDDRFRHIPVILFSGNNNIADQAKEAGAEFYLNKPFDIGELEMIVTNAVAHYPQQS